MCENRPPELSNEPSLDLFGVRSGRGINWEDGKGGEHNRLGHLIESGDDKDSKEREREAKNSKVDLISFP